MTMSRRNASLAAGWVLCVLAGSAAPAGSALSCEELFGVLEKTVEYRDQGYSLQQVLNALKGGPLEAKLSATEQQVLRKSVSAVYLGNATPDEVALACKQAQSGK